MVEHADDIIAPLPYHIELRDYLKSDERELWDWFASARAQAEYTDNLRMGLLKSTYRLDAGSHPELYQGVEEAKARLRLDMPVTIYQGPNNPQPNATLCFVPGEGHIVFSGQMLNLLSGDEIKAVIGHELAHHHLWEWEDGELHIADRLLQAVVEDPRAAESHEHTARRYQLYTEIFADRGALSVTGDVHPVVACLVKINTGLTQVSAEAYLKQAQEIFANGNVVTGGLSHPETFIRARALALWHEQGNGAEAQIARMIEGSESLGALDLIGQMRMADQTRGLLEYFLQPRWFQTPAVLGHARMFFADFQPATTKDASALDAFRAPDAKMRDYLAYVLLDFVTADPELDEVPLAAALELSRQLEFDSQFEKIAAKELKLKIRDVRKLKDNASEMLAKAEASP